MAAGGSSWGGSPSSWGGGQSEPRSQGPAWGGAPKAPTPKTSGWLGAADEEGSSAWSGGGTATQAPGAGSGWLGGAGGQPAAEGKDWAGAPKAETPTGGGWLGAEPESTTEDTMWGSAGSSSPKSSLSSMVDDAIEETERGDDFDDESWVDDEAEGGLEDEPLAGEVYDDPRGGAEGAGAKILVALLIVIVLGCGFYLLQPNMQDQPVEAASTSETQVDHAQSLLLEAKRTADGGQYELASVQALSAIDMMVEAKAEPAKIEEARLTLAKLYDAAQDYDKAADQYDLLISTGSNEAKYQALLDDAETNFDKQQRVVANGLLTDAKQQVKRDSFNSAISLANQALALFEDHNGSRAQLGQCHGVLGLAYYHGYDYGHAEDHLVQAVNLYPDGGYQSALNQVRAAYAPEPTRRSTTPKVTVIRQSSSVPSGNRRVSHRRSRRSQSGGSAAAAPAPAPASSAPQKREAPPFKRAKSSGLRPPGGDNGLKSYYNTSSPFK
ncbi:MAG: tetratricopeptide repeat protein [Vulcanimicrobiota bacterium]